MQGGINGRRFIKEFSVQLTIQTEESFIYYISFSSICKKINESLSSVQLFATSQTIQSMEFSRPEYCSGQHFPSPGKLPNPGIEPRFPALQVDSLPAETQGKPKSTGVGSLAFLHRIFPIQELKLGLMHCRQILYLLSSQGSPACEESRT